MNKVAANRTCKSRIRTAKYSTCALLALLTASALHAQSPKAPIIDNERVRVWDITLAPGQPAAMQHHDLDFVTMYLTGGDIRTTTADGKSTFASHTFGDAVYGHAGTEEKEEVVSTSPARLVVIELKNHLSPAYGNKTGYPPAFPRSGAKKVFENDRIVCWTYTWLPNVPIPMHFHDKDGISIHRLEGSLKFTAQDGTVTTHDSGFGTTRFNVGGRAHTEELAQGQQSSMTVELK